MCVGVGIEKEVAGSLVVERGKWVEEVDSLAVVQVDKKVEVLADKLEEEDDKRAGVLVDKKAGAEVLADKLAEEVDKRAGVLVDKKVEAGAQADMLAEAGGGMLVGAGGDKKAGVVDGMTLVVHGHKKVASCDESQNRSNVRSLHGNHHSRVCQSVQDVDHHVDRTDVHHDMLVETQHQTCGSLHQTQPL